MDKIIGIYKILNKNNGKFYIGSSNNLNKRKREHFTALKRGTHINTYLQRSFNKHGEESFEFIILECVLDTDSLLSIEQKYIDTLNACNRSIGYNINELAGGGGLYGKNNPNFGKIMTDEQKQKISDTLKGHIVSIESRNKMSKSKKGKFAGENHPMYGKKRTEEQKKYHSLKMTGRFKGENNPMYGKKLSKEAKIKMSEAKHGKTGGKCPNSVKIVQLSKENQYINEYNSMQEAQREINIFASGIQMCCVGKLKTSGGYKWMYYDEYIKLQEITTIKPEF